MKNLKTALRNPRNESKPWALWIWNRVISEQELIGQLRSFIDFGFGGVAIRPGPDMVPAYLSEEFCALFEIVCSMAQQAGIGVRIADDFALPGNGFFQESALRQSSLRAQTINLEHTFIVQAKGQFQLPVEPTTDLIVMSAQMLPNGQIDLDSCREVHVTKDQLLYPVGAYDTRIMVFRKNYFTDPLGNYMPNPFNPKAAQAYIQHVLEPLKLQFSKYIPTTLEGFVTEMPAVLPAENSIPWDDDLVVKYRSKYKKDLLKILPELFFEVDDRSVRNRVQFYGYMAQVMYERFAGQLETWAKKFRLSQWVLAPERDILRSDNALIEQLAIPCVPLSTVGIQNQQGTEENYHALRMTADVNAVEFRRETVTVIGRNRLGDAATIQSLKNEIDCAALNGPSRILIDGLYFNIEHRNQVRTPTNPNWYYPGWEQMKDLCKYATCLMETNNQPDSHVARSVAVVVPSASVMAEYTPGNNESAVRGSDNLRKVTEGLEGENITYDIVSENRLLSCAVRVNGEFGAADRVRGNYQAVVVPFARYISKSMFVLLEKIAAKKGTIVFIDEQPTGCIEEGCNHGFTERVEKLIRTRRDCIHIKPAEEIGEVLRTIDSPVKMLVNGKPCKDLYSSIVTNDGYDHILVHNMNDRDDYYAHFELPAGKKVAFVDCSEGELYRIEKVFNEEKKTTFGLSFEPNQSYLLAVADDLEELAVVSAEHPVNRFGSTPRSYRIMLKDKWGFLPHSLNVLPLANWNMRIGLSRETGGYSHYSEAYFEVKHIPEICVLVLCGMPESGGNGEFGSSYEIAINGTTISPFNPEEKDPEVPTPSWTNFCGRHTLKYDLKDYIISDVNRISFRTVGEYTDPQPLLYPPIIAGDFSISKGAKGWTIDEPASTVGYDSWTRHGYPYLSGVGIYSQDFEVPTEFKRIVLKFSQSTGPLQVTLNGHDLGVLKWHSLEADITDICRKRRNELIVRVSNTMDNLLRMNGRPSGFLGEAYLDIFQE